MNSDGSLVTGKAFDFQYLPEVGKAYLMRTTKEYDTKKYYLAKVEKIEREPVVRGPSTVKATIRWLDYDRLEEGKELRSLRSVVPVPPGENFLLRLDTQKVRDDESGKIGLAYFLEFKEPVK